MIVIVTRIPPNPGAPRTYAWTVPDPEKLWAFHAHASREFGFYEARPWSSQF